MNAYQSRGVKGKQKVDEWGEDLEMSQLRGGGESSKRAQQTILRKVSDFWIWVFWGFVFSLTLYVQCSKL
jgi:hypothetical protein